MVTTLQTLTGAANARANPVNSLQLLHSTLMQHEVPTPPSLEQPNTPTTNAGPTCSISFGLGTRRPQFATVSSAAGDTKLTLPAHWMLIVQGDGAKATAWKRYYHVRSSGSGMVFYSLAPTAADDAFNAALQIPVVHRFATIPWHDRLRVGRLAARVEPRRCAGYVIALLAELESERVLAAGTADAARVFVEDSIETQLRGAFGFGTVSTDAPMRGIHNMCRSILRYAEDGDLDCMDFDTCFYETGAGFSG
ncbi:hypothetical protein BJX64DRAFT_288913 [Aspergillus heterothallicus]